MKTMNSDQCNESHKEIRIESRANTETPEMGSCALEEEASSVDRLHPLWALFLGQVHGVNCIQNRVKTALQLI